MILHKNSYKKEISINFVDFFFILQLTCGYICLSWFEYIQPFKNYLAAGWKKQKFDFRFDKFQLLFYAW